MKTIVTQTVVFSIVGIFSCIACVAQPYQTSQSGANWGQRGQLDYQYQNQLTHQNPRAALVGGILGAIGAGLNADNPKKNAAASQVLGSLGNTFNQLSGPQYSEQGRIRYQQQGYRNQWQQRQGSMGNHGSFGNQGFGNQGSLQRQHQQFQRQGFHQFQSTQGRPFNGGFQRGTMPGRNW